MTNILAFTILSIFSNCAFSQILHYGCLESNVLTLYDYCIASESSDSTHYDIDKKFVEIDDKSIYLKPRKYPKPLTSFDLADSVLICLKGVKLPRESNRQKVFSFAILINEEGEFCGFHSTNKKPLLEIEIELQLQNAVKKVSNEVDWQPAKNCGKKVSSYYILYLKW